MKIECQFIQHTFHYISVYLVLNSASLTCCPSLRTHSSNLSPRSPSSRFVVFSGIGEISFRTAILNSSMVRGLVVYSRFEVPPHDIRVITGTEIRRTCRPWKLAAQWNNALRNITERPPWMSSLYGQLRNLAGTIRSRGQFWCGEVP
jgi:hypothetical protein